MPMLDRAKGNLYYDVCDCVPPWFEPETILFLNGLAIDSDIWVTWLPELIDRYRVVRVDLRGFGRSFVPTAQSEWTLSGIVDDVLDVMRALSLERVHYVGESTGGTVGLLLAAEHPQRLLSLTTVSAAHRGSSILRAVILRDEIQSLGMDAWSEKLMPLRFRAESLTPEMHTWFHDRQRGSLPQSCARLINMLVGCDLSDKLAAITVPTLILAADDSPFVSVESQLERRRTMPNAEFSVVPAARHGVAYSHGEACARVLREFIGRCNRHNANQ